MTYKNLIYETTTGTGTSTLTLATVTGWRDFATAFGTGAGNPFVYVIRHQSAAEYEVGTGYMSDSTTLVRSAVVDSSNSNALVSFSAGTKDVWHAVPAADANNFINQTLIDAKGDLIVGSAADTAARLAVGTDGQILAAESGASGGLAWRWAPSNGVGLYVGDYFRASSGALATSTSISSSGQLHAFPFPILRDCTLDRIGFEYTVSGGTGAKVRLGLYANNNGRPGALIVDSGEFDVTAAAGVKEATISVAVKAGLYFAAYVFYGGTAPTWRYINNNYNTNISNSLGSSIPSASGGLARTQYVASVTGALPNPFGTVAGTNDYSIPLILRASA